MIEHNKNFYSLEELERTRDSLKGYLDNEEVYYFVGAIRYACDEIERLNNIIKEVREILNTQLAFTSSYQLNYQSAMSVIEEAKSILDKEKV